MQSIRGIIKDIKTKSVEKVNGQTSIRNYSTTGGKSSVTNSQVWIGKTLVSFTKSKNFENFKFEKGDELIVVGNMVDKSMVALNYHNITKNITESMKNSFIALYIFISLLFFAGIIWSGYMIVSNKAIFTTYIIGVLSVLFFIVFFMITLTAIKAKIFLLNEIKKL